jgi:hypothetical protein
MTLPPHGYAGCAPAPGHEARQAKVHVVFVAVIATLLRPRRLLPLALRGSLGHNPLRRQMTQSDSRLARRVTNY